MAPTPLSNHDEKTLILVRVKIEDGRCARLSPGAVKLRRGAAVVWHFQGVPEGFEPGLDFVKFTPLRGKSRRPINLQPFQNVTFYQGRIIAEGLRGWPGTYQYEIVLKSTTDTSTLRLSSPPSDHGLLRVEMDKPRKVSSRG